MTPLFTSKNIRYRILRAYFYSILSILFVCLLGRIVTSRFIKEVKINNQLYFHVTHQYSHISIFKEHLLLVNHYSSPKAIVQDLQNDFLTLQKNHQQIIQLFNQQKAYLGLEREPLLLLHLSRALKHFYSVEEQFKKIISTPSPSAHQIKIAIAHSNLYEKQLHLVIHDYFEDIEQNFSILDIWVNLALTSILTLVGLFMAITIVRPSFIYLSQYLIKTIQSQREINKKNRELQNVNQHLKVTQELLKTEQHRSMQALQEKLALVVDQEKYLIKGQEEERKRVARELHDSIGQMLTGIKYGLDVLKKEENSADIAAPLDVLLHLTNQTIEETRRILMALLPSTLETFGILGAVQSFIDGLQIQNPKVHFQLIQTNTPLPPLSNWVSLGIFRIIQEGITNSLKHSSPNEVLVELEVEQNSLIIRIIDDGTGFDVSNINGISQYKFGIENMKQRCKLLAGKFHLESIINQGTEIQAIIPIFNP